MAVCKFSGFWANGEPVAVGTIFGLQKKQAAEGRPLPAPRRLAREQRDQDDDRKGYTKK
jgi:hypothetical protein